MRFSPSVSHRAHWRSTVTWCTSRIGRRKLPTKKDKPVSEKHAVDKGGAPAGAEVTPEPSAPRDATRAEKEEIVYPNLSDLHPFKNHPFGVRDDAEMQGLVESVKAAGGRSARAGASPRG